MQQISCDIYTCFGCKKLYNIDNRKPLELPCEDIICQQCYNSQRDQVQNQQIQCPYDNTHLCAIDHPVTENKFLLRNLRQQNFYLINCDEHLENQAQIYCKLRNKIICTSCMLVNPHLKCPQDGETHFAFDRKLLENSFEKVLPLFYDEIESINNLIHNANAFVFKERGFNVNEIEKMINKSCQILQLSPINDQIKTSLRERTDVLNFITNFTPRNKQSMTFSSQKINVLYNQLFSLFQFLLNRKEKAENVNQLDLRVIILQAILNSDNLMIASDNAFRQINQINNEGQQQVLVQSQEEIRAISIQNQLIELKVSVGALQQSQIDNLANQFNQLQARLDFNDTLLAKSIKPEIEKSFIFRRLVDSQLDAKYYPKLFKIPGKCNLIYKGSRDGFKVANFHSKCDNQGPTISFIQSEHVQIFGGYTSISWTSHNSYHKDDEAFVFSLTKNTLHKQYQRFDQAVRHYKDYSIVFGGGCDIYISNDCNINQSSNSNLGHTYMAPQGFKKDDQFCKDYLAGSYNFKVIEIEVYSVTI
ncbi:tldc domain-containing protein [Stylonychia lemnae]|uniref:Tldc domain-containing protein n=1 Tax=Stylonychia lemnae TaxID=5949 RepID=A0A077ZU05_STYLE|nr:tldc domain-containing protein [Stylonychia lemnae]|eukprot:CDW73378.1 tldc domain-containing protein [Stylonychia lemnae]